jgi:hypothetical protein
MLVINNNYAMRTIAGFGSNNAFITLAATFRTKDTIPAGGIIVVGNNAQDQYTGIRINATNELIAGMKTVTGSPGVVATLLPNTLYTVTLTRDNAGNTTTILNGSEPVNRTVAPGGLSYNYYSVGGFRGGSAGFVATAIIDIAHVALYTRILSEEEIAAYHAKNLSGIATTNRVDYHSLISNLNSSAGGTALTFVDAEQDAVVFDNVDPFPPPPSITSAADPIIGQRTAMTVANFEPPVNDGELDGVKLISADNTGILSAGLVDEQMCPRAGANRVLVVRRGTKSASTAKTVKAPLGLVAVEVAPGFQTGEVDSVAHNFNPPLKVGDIFYHDPTKGTIGTNASYNGDFEGEQIIWHHEAATKIARSFKLITGEGGQVISVKRWMGATYMAAQFIKTKKVTASGF